MDTVEEKRAPPKILLVDNDHSTGDFVYDTLTYEGYNVLIETSAERALEMLKYEPFEVIITELKLPDMDGIDFMEASKQIAPGTDIIVMTGFPSMESAIKVIGLGVVDYITKPIKMDQIKDVVKKALNKRLMREKALKTELYKKLSELDGLTEVFNHRSFQEILKTEIARAKRYNRRLSLIILDVDHFKIYNDKNGHPMGDLALKKIASILKSSLRESDFVARYGGEEFGLILPDTPLEGAHSIAEQLRIKVEKTKFEGERNMPRKRLTTSLGIATYPQHAIYREDLIYKADQALYQAKIKGRNRVHAFKG